MDRGVARELHADLSAPLPILPTTERDQPAALDESRLWEQYKNACDEYRFQVNLNWSRSQYYFVLNVAILAAGIGLLGSTLVPAGVALAVFGVGAASGVISLLATDVQKTYYQNARDHKRKFEDDLGLGDYALKTTVGQGGKRERIARVTTFQKTILGALILADLVGLGVSIAHMARSMVTPVEVALRIDVVGSRAQTVPVVLSKDGKVKAALTPAPGTTSLVRVDPGTYQVSALASGQCGTIAKITATPLQSVVVHCGHKPAKHKVKRRAGRGGQRGP